jgi:hypothetical protein
MWFSDEGEYRFTPRHQPELCGSPQWGGAAFGAAFFYKNYLHLIKKVGFDAQAVIPWMVI